MCHETDNQMLFGYALVFVIHTIEASRQLNTLGHVLIALQNIAWYLPNGDTATDCPIF